VETSAGTSELYSRSKNNFGIKCKANWTGKITLHDDDAIGECFRVYDNDSLSYVDHSNFLKLSSRYDFLFYFDKSDYKSWAYGLKRAGYATNPKYPALIIKQVEENNLTRFDNPSYKMENDKELMAYLNNKLSKPVAATAKVESYKTSTSAGPAAEKTPDLDMPDEIKIVHWDTQVSNATDAHGITPNRNYSARKAGSGSAKAVYVVRKGDTLSSVARKYGVSVTAIKQANGLRSNTIAMGRKLRIPRG